MPLYRPVTTFSYLLNYSVFGNADRPAGYHVVNWLLHTANVWLVFGLAVRIGRRFWPAAFAAALWAVHPLGTEAVTNIVGRADLLAAFGVLLSFLRPSRRAGCAGPRTMVVDGTLAAGDNGRGIFEGKRDRGHRRHRAVRFAAATIVADPPRWCAIGSSSRCPRSCFCFSARRFSPVQPLNSPTWTTPLRVPVSGGDGSPP